MQKAQKLRVGREWGQVTGGPASLAKGCDIFLSEPEDTDTFQAGVGVMADMCEAGSQATHIVGAQCL